MISTSLRKTYMNNNFQIIFYFKLLLTGHLNQTKLLTFLQLVRRRAESSLQKPTYRPAPLGKCRSHYHWWCTSCCSTLHRTKLFSPSIPAKIGRVHYRYAILNTEDKICELHTDFTYKGTFKIVTSKPHALKQNKNYQGGYFLLHVISNRCTKMYL